MTRPLSICWFRQDLRLADNPALCAAAARGEVLPVFILDDGAAREDRIGAANRWWLHHSLAALKASLGGVLHVMAGDALELIPRLVAETGASAVHWNRSYEAWRIERDSNLKAALTAAGTEAVSHNGALLWEPWEVQKGDGTPYKVFTPFYRRGCLAAAPPRAPLPAPQIGLATPPSATSVDDLNLLPAEDWGEMLAPHWQIGEAGAEARLQAFVDGGIAGYKEGRNIPAKPHVSRLSPHLHWGEISVNRVWHAARDRNDLPADDVDNFCSELGWREFSHSLLYFNPELKRRNLQTKFDGFDWREDDGLLRAWQRGMTGVPFVDAAMRELWQTGYMHNRMRMVTGSFLVKNLRLHWHHGEAWFWELPCRCRSRKQQRLMAVDRRMRRGCRPLLPCFQPGHARREVRQGRRLYTPLLPRACRSARQISLRPLDRAEGGSGRCWRAARRDLSAAGRRSETVP